MMGKQKEEAVGVDIQEELLFSQVNAPAFELSCLCYLNFLELPPGVTWRKRSSSHRWCRCSAA